MPKEIVIPPGSDFNVHVGWSSTGNIVQVATITKDVARAVAVAKDIFERAEASPHELTTGYYADLDEASITTLIGHLQRARRRAFGIDEPVSDAASYDEAVANAGRLLKKAETTLGEDNRRSLAMLADYWLRVAEVLRLAQRA